MLRPATRGTQSTEKRQGFLRGRAICLRKADAAARGPKAGPRLSEQSENSVETSGLPTCPHVLLAHS